MDKMILSAVELPERDPQECKGKFYRCKKNIFVNSKGEYVNQIRMVPLKKMSCPGCEQCGYLVDDLEEYAAIDHDGIAIENAENGGLYRLEITNIHRDWESGQVDDWDLEFAEVKNGR